MREAAEDVRLLLLIDQFEEVFTRCPNNPEGRAKQTSFIENLRYAATSEDSRAVIVITMRADFAHRAAEFSSLAELLSHNQFIVSPMEPRELRSAIEEPARLAGLRFEPGLVERILSDVGHEPGALPLLEHALFELCEDAKRKGENVLTVQAYEQSGGVQGALAQKAEAIFARFTPEQQTILRRVMLRLTQPGEGTADTRRRAAQHELWNRAKERAAVEQVIHTLADERLLTTSRDANGAEQVDVAHEALIRGWPRLRRWIDEDREFLLWQQRFKLLRKIYLDTRLDRESLLRGPVLDEAKRWFKDRPLDFSDGEVAFIKVSDSIGVKASRFAARLVRFVLVSIMAVQAYRYVWGKFGPFDALLAWLLLFSFLFVGWYVSEKLSRLIRHILTGVALTEMQQK